jgi:hypothetical protein
MEFGSGLVEGLIIHAVGTIGCVLLPIGGQ